MADVVEVQQVAPEPFILYPPCPAGCGGPTTDIDSGPCVPCQLPVEHRSEVVPP